MTELLAINSLCKAFGSGSMRVDALTDVSLQVQRGECLAVVGESGSGKTTLANCILGIHSPTSGEIIFNGSPLPAERTLKHRQSMQLVQQNPLSSLNPKRSIGASVRLGLDVYNIATRSERKKLTEASLEAVGLPADFYHRAPSELSGGQRQRAAIARALACGSEFIVLDEPTSALDVLVQARVLRMLEDLRMQKNLTYLFITHDLSVVRNVADRVAVFQHGRLVEIASTQQLFDRPQHPYTRQLIAAVPVLGQAELDYREHIRSLTPAYGGKN